MPPKGQPAIKNDSQELPTKEAALFRTLLKQYETKQYKKGIKTADLILKKFPNNGETQAMKGLLFNCLDKKEEAYELVKLGVRNNIRSHVCWHVYGLLYRSDRVYDEAIKCYKSALRMEKDNLTVLKDLAQLQIQMRDLSGFLETRQLLLEQKPNNPQNWVSLALAHHLNGSYEVAAEMISTYVANIVQSGDTVSLTDAYELSEILLYKVQILIEGGLYEEALKSLTESEQKGSIKDKIAALELRARISNGLNRHDEAEQMYHKLLNLNSENYRWHDGLRSALQLPIIAESAASAAVAVSQDQRSKLTALYATVLQPAFPKSIAAKRLPLEFLTGQDFSNAVDSYVRKYLANGIPSLFSDLKPLYGDAVKAQQIGDVMSRIESSLVSSGEFPPTLIEGDAASSISAANKGGEPLLWTRLYLALHHDVLGNTAEAIKLIDGCIKESPDGIVELYSARSTILKHAGDPQGALQAADKARKMDKGDRYLNCLAVKAGFRAGQIDRAEKTAALFTRDGEQNNNLFDMQATWYEIASARAYFKQQNLGMTLKRLLKVESHFEDFAEDQFDFHSYCVRKQTMRAYVDMLRMEDALFNHKVYSKAAGEAITAYVYLFDNPAMKEDEDALAGMSAEEQKAYRQKKKKEEQKKQKAAAAAVAAEEEAAAKKGQKTNEDGTKKKIDTDPFGYELAATTEPLEKATKLVERLVLYASEKLPTHLLAFEVYSRKNKLLLATKAVKQAIKVAGASHPDVHRNIIRLAVLSTSTDKSEDAVTQQVVADEIKEILNGSTVDSYHASWVSAHGDVSTLARAAAVEVEALISPTSTAAVDRLVQQGPSGATHKECVAVLSILTDRVKNTSAADRWKQACAAVFKWSRVFGGNDCVALEPEEDDVNGQLAELNIKS